MKRIILDTNAYVAYKQNNEAVKEIICRVEYIGFPSTVLGELLGGFALGNKEADNRQELHQFLSSSRVTILPVNENTANYYANIYKVLRKKGRPIPTNDMWIAASALEHGCILCTFDTDFAHIDGLLSINKLEQLYP